MFLPCVCDDKNCKGLNDPEFCELVKYEPQDIKKAERLAKQANVSTDMMAYKLCINCRWYCKR